MKPQPTGNDFAAFIGIDWADAKHDICLQAAHAARRESSVLPPRLSRSIQFSPFVGIENSPSPWLSRRLLGAHQAGFELLFEPVGVAADIQGDGMVQDAV